MPRLCRPPLALLAGAVAAAVAAAAPLPACAQDATDSNLLGPQTVGDPRYPQRFARPGGQVVKQSAGQIGQSLLSPPASGAGLTGFDSTNARKQKNQPGQKAKPAAATSDGSFAQGLQRPLPQPAIGATSATSGQAGPATTSSTAARFTQNQNQNQNAAQPQNQNQALSQNQTQQRRALPATDTAYPIAGVLDTVPTVLRRRTAVTEVDAFAPTGIQAGAFTLRPAIEVTGAYDTNPARVTTGTPSWYSVVAPELQLNSNWARHELTATIRGSYTTYENASDLNRPSLDAKANGRIDLTPWTRVDLESRFLVGTDNPGSPNIQAGLAKLPIFTTLGGSAGIGQRFNRLELTAKGSVDRTVYQESLLTDGTTSSNADRDFNRFGADLRASYEVMPGVKPFAEFGADRREHDITLDRNGLQRDSDGHYVRGGTTFELSRILTGDVAVGWIARNYKDPTLPDVSGLTFDSSLSWVASALTTVKLSARTSVDESTLPGVSGVFTREVALQVDHAFRRWLLATVKYTLDFDDYVGLPRLDQRHAVSALLTYKLTRELWLKAEYRREWRHSNEPGNDNLANVFLLGVRLQR